MSTSPASRKPRLGSYLSLWFSLLSIVLTLVLVQVIGMAASEALRVNIGNGLAAIAGQAVDKLDRGMYERYREVRLMAQRSDIESSRVPAAAKRRVLESIRATYPYYAWIGLTDMNGTVKVATGAMLEGADVSKRPWFHNALKGVHLGDVHDAVLLAKLLPSTSNEPKRFVDVAFPYVDEHGRQAGVLGTHLSWSWAREVERSVFVHASRRPLETLIASADGTVLLGPEGMRDTRLDLGSVHAARSGNGYMVEDWPDGKRYLVGYAQSQGYADYPGLGWKVLVRQELKTAYEPVAQIQQKAFWSGMAVAALFTVMGFVTARRITKPIVELAQASQRMGAGETLLLPASSASFREVESLSGALSDLVGQLVQQKDALAELNVSLEQRVAERTRELASALEVVRIEQERVRTIVETAQDAYVATDLAGRVIEWNAAAERMFGWSKAEAIGASLPDLVLPEALRARFRQTYLALESGRLDVSGRLQRTVIDRAGREFPVELSVGMLSDRGQTFVSAFLHDISERRKIEQLKNEFISTVSHELRTPLTSISASLSMLNDGMAGELPEDIRVLIGIANASCERLVRLVNNVLDIEKIEAGGVAYDIGEQDVCALVESAAASMQAFAQEHGVTLAARCADGLRARTDADAVSQVLANLLSNAIKFSQRGGEVQLRAEPHESGVRIVVADNGRGIPLAFRSTIFQKFAQADASDSRERGGTGLGLAITKRIVEDLGGSIGFDSEEGKGTSFYVILPG
ncbi:ATP-binding protein [Pseudoduganella sp. GCM10020061]|uniref:ATP-binding protein n=1 Tax=Pseudoduganella sp. GCM10020061 TaxID=3317345 RepID=UPI003637E50B